jgi:hypothetical protein
MKKLTVLISGSVLVCCTSSPVYCHHWQKNDEIEIKRALKNLPDNSPLHPVIIDYERVCINLK